MPNFTPCQRRRAIRIFAAILISVILLTACGKKNSSADPDSIPNSIPNSKPDKPSISTPPKTLPPRDSKSLETKLVSVATNLNEPVAIASVGTDTYFGEKAGRIRLLDEARSNPVALDISRRVESASYEQGLLGMTFSPDRRYLYVAYTHVNGSIVLDALRWHGRGTPNSGWRTILSIPDPQSNHNGGDLKFGADAMLWMSSGDGGAANDEGDGHAKGGNGQSLETLLGKIIRINPTPEAKNPYAIPADNPFAKNLNVGKSNARREIWAYGLRNPWRFHIDQGMLWIADVGQSSFEEINRVSTTSGAGSNFGWNIYEGTSTHRAGRSADAVAPIFEYPTAGNNCAIIGGIVARDPRFKALDGKYLFADACAGDLKTLVFDNQGIAKSVSLNAHVDQPTTFGVDAAGAVLIASQSGTIYRLAPK